MDRQRKRYKDYHKFKLNKNLSNFEIIDDFVYKSKQMPMRNMAFLNKVA